MTLKSFTAAVQDGFFVDDDGIGFYATATSISDKPVKPSDIARGKIESGYTHVMWFNK